MYDGKLVKKYQNPDGKGWIELRVQSDGLFFFVEYFEDFDEVPGYGTETFINSGSYASFYGNAEDAESDLRKMIPLLREISN